MTLKCILSTGDNPAYNNQSSPHGALYFLRSFKFIFTAADHQANDLPKTGRSEMEWRSMTNLKFMNLEPASLGVMGIKQKCYGFSLSPNTPDAVCMIKLLPFYCSSPQKGRYPGLKRIFFFFANSYLALPFFLWKPILYNPSENSFSCWMGCCLTSWIGLRESIRSSN